jgi:hypothetical protein
MGWSANGTAALAPAAINVRPSSAPRLKVPLRRAAFGEKQQVKIRVMVRYVMVSPAW